MLAEVVEFGEGGVRMAAYDETGGSDLARGEAGCWPRRRASRPGNGLAG